MNGNSSLEVRHQASGCNAYCRDGRHAQVVWETDTRTGPEGLRRLCASVGVQFIDAQPAHEARPPREVCIGAWSDGTPTRGYVEPGDRAWLLVWQPAA